MSYARKACFTVQVGLENLANTLLGQIPSAGMPELHQQIRAQYALVFQQRLDGALRDIEIGFISGSSVAATDSPPAASAQQNKEIVSLKLGAWGMSIDLKELWRRWKHMGKAG